MHVRLPVILTVLLALVLTACSGGGETALTDTDTAFLEGMVPHHSQAVEMAALVEGRTAHPDELGGLAEEITSTQRTEIDTMNALLVAGGQEPADAGSGMEGMSMGEMEGMMSAEDMASLEELEGDAFDQQFLTMMIAHHRGAIASAEDVLAQDGDAEVADLAEEIMAAQQTEIEQMEQWQTDWA